MAKTRSVLKPLTRTNIHSLIPEHTHIPNEATLFSASAGFLMGSSCSTPSVLDPIKNASPSPGAKLRRAIEDNDEALFRGLFAVFTPSVLLEDRDPASGRTALHTAIVCGRIEMAALIVARGLSLNGMVRLRDAAGDSALDLAVWKRSAQAVQLLLAARVGLECAPFGQNGWTPLHIAAFLDDDQITRLICTSVTPVGVKNCVAASTGDTPLHVAARRNAYKTVGVLLNLGALVQAVNSNRLTPLHVACLHGSTACVRLLAPAASDSSALNPRNSTGHTPLHYAARSGNTAACRSLVSAGADVDAKSTTGETAVFLAALAGHVDTVTFLVSDAGAHIDVKVGEHLVTALHVASAANRSDIVAALLARPRGSEIDATNDEGRTALHVACATDHSDVVLELLRSGASALALDAAGHSALQNAQDAGAMGCLAALAGCAALGEPREAALDDATAAADEGVADRGATLTPSANQRVDV
jgi:ankyrin